MLDYFKKVRKEAEKVVYPTRDELKRDAVTTIAFCTAAALFLWGISEAVIFVVSYIVR